MNQLHVWKFALGAAAAFVVLDVVCTLAFVLSPDNTIALFNTWFHGMDLKLLVPSGGKTVTATQVVVGVVSAAVVSFAGGAVLASCYNWLGRTDRQ